MPDRQGPNVLGDQRLVREVRGVLGARGPLLDVLERAEDDVPHPGLNRGIGELAPEDELVGRWRRDRRRHEEGPISRPERVHELALMPRLQGNRDDLSAHLREALGLDGVGGSGQRSHAEPPAAEQGRDDTPALLAGRTGDDDQGLAGIRHRAFLRIRSDEETIISPHRDM